MVIAETAAAAFAGFKNLFLYNRETYFFNRGINQARIYQTQKMRIEQLELYREDLRDLYELTVARVDNYLIANTIVLVFCAGIFYEGRLPSGREMSPDGDDE
jgi:hypothetical protein